MVASGLQVEQRTRLRKFDFNFALVILALNVIGLINLYSATHGANSTDMSRLFLSQIFWLAIGWTGYLICTIIDYKFFVRLAYVVYATNLLLLVAVKYVGVTALGAQRWLDFGFFRFQPSETMKVALVLVLTPILSKYSANKGLGIKELILPIIIVAIPFILTVKQPDLGTAISLAAIAGCMILFVGVRKQILIVIGLILVIAAPIAWNYGLKPYQRQRVYTFLDPGKDPRGSGYNSIQSKIAVGSGKLLGKGFRKGTQSQLEFLPERHTDFIFSVLSEEHGFIGSMTTLGLFLILLILGVRIASQARDKTGALLVVGILSIIFFHMFVNIGMVIGLLPIVGIPLPLVSYGGSSMLTTLFGLGFISSVSLRKFLF